MNITSSEVLQVVLILTTHFDYSTKDCSDRINSWKLLKTLENFQSTEEQMEQIKEEGHIELDGYKVPYEYISKLSKFGNRFQ